MASILPGYVYDIFISYRHNDNQYDGWVSEFVEKLRRELVATVKEKLTIYFDENPEDGLLESHHVDHTISSKIKALVFIPIVSQTYCDTKSFAWNQELGRNLIFFYSSVGLFLLSIALRTNASVSMVIGVVSFLVAIPFLISLLRKQQHEIKSKSVTLLQFIIASKNKAGLVFVFFVSSALFTVLSRYWGVIPSIENVDRPKDYIELINSSESGKEKPIDGQYQHEACKQTMDKFFERHGEK